MTPFLKEPRELACVLETDPVLKFLHGGKIAFVIAE